MRSIYASIPTPEVSFFTVGNFRVHFYALFILAGIAVAIWIGNRRLKARGGESGLILDVSLWAVPFGIVGGRIFHVLTHWNDYFGTGANPISALYVWEGGLAIYGALIGGAVGIWLGSRIAGLRFWSVLDAIAPGVLLAQALGRWGNYFNGELYGTPTDLPWGLEIPAWSDAYPKGLPEGVLFHPTFLYESIWSVIGFVLLLLIDRKFKLRWGKLFGLYLIYYSIGRIWVENLRIDPSDILLGLRTNVWSAIFGIVIGIAIIYVQRRNHPEAEASPYLPGREPKPEVDGAEGEAAEVAEAPKKVENSDEPYETEAPKKKPARAKQAADDSSKQ